MGCSYEVKISGQFGAVRQLDFFSEEISHSRRRLPVHLDLSGVEFMRPLAVMATVLFFEKMLARRREVRVTFPRHPGVLNYLVGIGLPDIMNQLGEWEWPNDFPQEATKGLRPMIRLTRFSTSDEIERISTQMEGVFDADSVLPGTLRYACYYVFSELADNVVNHSESCGYVLGQRFEYQEGPVIDMAVGDCGTGVMKALWRNPDLRPQLRDDRAALQLAMKDGVTSIPDLYRGYGLGYVNRELSTAGRRLVIRSGKAVGSWKEGKRIQLYQCGDSVGTLAHAVIPC